jgi:hypothetical protein
MLGIALIILAILCVAAVFSLRPTDGFSALKVPLPPVGSSLSPEQLAEVQAHPNATFHYRRECLELFVDATFLCGSFLLIAGIVSNLRKVKTAKLQIRKLRPSSFLSSFR